MGAVPPGRAIEGSRDGIRPLGGVPHGCRCRGAVASLGWGLSLRPLSRLASIGLWPLSRLVAVGWWPLGLRLRPLRWGGLSRLRAPGLRLPLPRGSPRHLPLAFVVERQAKGIAKGDERPLHGIGFGLLDGRFMGEAEIDVDAMASSCALADEQSLSTSGNGDAHPCDVGHPPAGPLALADEPLGLGNALAEEGLALPAIKAKDAVGFLKHHKALEVVHPPPALLAGGDEGAIKGSVEGLDLLGGEAAGGLGGGGLSAIFGICFSEHLDHRGASGGGWCPGGLGRAMAVGGWAGAAIGGGKRLAVHGVRQ